MSDYRPTTVERRTPVGESLITMAALTALLWVMEVIDVLSGHQLDELEPLHALILDLRLLDAVTAELAVLVGLEIDAVEQGDRALEDQRLDPHDARAHLP